MKRRVLVLVIALGAAGLPLGEVAQARGRHPTPALLDCIAHYESEHRGGRPYRSTYHDPQGNRGGRYQFTRRTWNALVQRMGRPRLAEQHPYHASSQDQDDAAGQLVRERGLQPWPTPSRYCR